MPLKPMVIEKYSTTTLLGKIYFNMGAAESDNPQGNLEKAAKYYTDALANFHRGASNDDIVRATVRLAKVRLLQNQPQEARSL